jgi:hypothetical protein
MRGALQRASPLALCFNPRTRRIILASCIHPLGDSMVPFQNFKGEV